jgi:hypothetical protein
MVSSTGQCNTAHSLCEVLVVANDSTDGSAEAIAEKFPHYPLFAQSDNLGFAAANNLAAKSARGEYILMLNPDTVVLDGAIDKLVAFERRRPASGADEHSSPMGG